jgi:hypothetical protein
LTLTRTRLAGSIALLLTVAASPVALDARPDGVSLAPVASVAPQALAAPAYRLGTAGRPFEWSTAVGDFNADGRPDVIVADRVSPWTRNAGYRLNFAISGEAVASESFEAPDDSIGIRVADVDHDSDLDIVLASVTSGRTIGVWLNDGAGHFTRSSMKVATAAVLSPLAADRGRPDGAPMTLDGSSRRSAAMSPVRARAPAPARTSPRLAERESVAVSLLVVSSAAPRAPPVLR